MNQEQFKYLAFMKCQGEIYSQNFSECNKLMGYNIHIKIFDIVRNRVTSQVDHQLCNQVEREVLNESERIYPTNLYAHLL